MAIEARDIATLISVVNWARMPPFAFDVEPEPGKGSFSIRQTSGRPRRARWNATLQPMTPAPMIATSA